MLKSKETEVKMKKYLAFDGINNEHEEFETIEEAREWLEELFLDAEQGYHPDTESCKIFELKEIIAIDLIDSQKNYKYLYEDDIPEDDKESEAWPYNTDFEEIWKHEFIEVSKQS